MRLRLQFLSQQMDCMGIKGCSHGTIVPVIYFSQLMSYMGFAVVIILCEQPFNVKYSDGAIMTMMLNPTAR